jgi:hypothetical protein
VDGAIEYSQADLYDVVCVIAHTRPIKPKPYPDNIPNNVMNPIAGIIADGAFPYVAIPYGKLNTPAPTILLTKLNISLVIVAVPPLPLVPLGWVDD